MFLTTNHYVFSRERYTRGSKFNSVGITDSRFVFSWFWRLFCQVPISLRYPSHSPCDSVTELQRCGFDIELMGRLTSRKHLIINRKKNSFKKVGQKFADRNMNVVSLQCQWKQ